MTDKNNKPAGKKPGASLKPRSPYIDLCQDLMFKIYFSRSKPLLLSLIKTFLPLPEGKTVQSLTVLNPAEKRKGPSGLSVKDSALYPESPEGKRAVLDLLVRLNTGETVNVEMQTIRHESFKERILFYLARIYGGMLKKGEGYENLRPAFSLVFADFCLFPEQKPGRLVSSFSVRSDKPPHFLLSDRFRLVFVDLSRFQAENATLLDSELDLEWLWCYFLKKAKDMNREEIAALAQKSKEMKMAMEHLKSLSRDQAVRFQEEAQEKFYRDFVIGKKTAIQRSMAVLKRF